MIVHIFIFFYIKCLFLQAKSDHTDLVSRRMGFIPLPLACLVRGCGLV